MTTAPSADSAPIRAVAIITLPVIPFRPMTNKFSCSSSAGSVNTAMNVRTSLRWKKNIFFSFCSVEIYLLGSSR